MCALQKIIFETLTFSQLLRYSLNEKSVFPMPLHDAETALEYIRAHSKELEYRP